MDQNSTSVQLRPQTAINCITSKQCGSRRGIKIYCAHSLRANRRLHKNAQARSNAQQTGENYDNVNIFQRYKLPITFRVVVQ